MGYISPESLANLEKYSYKGVDKSLLSRYVLSPYWNWLITLWPRTVAPNTITLTGLAIVFLNFFSLLYYDREYLTQKHGAVGPPRWLYFTWSIGLFAYQSLDAIDGKQARRTGMAGPLGEMFDHGCDALNTTLEVILASYALNLGRSWWTVASLIATHANFYLTTWEEYHTGQLYLGIFSGPVEGIIMIALIYFMTGIFGPSFWDQGILTFTHLSRIPPLQRLPDLPLNVAFMVFAGVGLGFNILTSYYNVRKSSRASNTSSLRPLLLLLPFVFSTLPQLAWLTHPNPERSQVIYTPVFVPFMCAWGLQFAHQVGRMILAHVTCGPFPVWDHVWLLSLIGALDANLGRIRHLEPLIQSTMKRTTLFVWATLVISLYLYGRFCYLVIRDITEYLGIACFTVKKKDEKGVWRKASPPVNAVNGFKSNGHAIPLGNAKRKS
ncbi:hypothetical protein AMATHDRAFT_151285 [Amanita thiersii Skay4041]|uniref:Choline/ethanolaminephosphotransferase n=1 Tax=Amanita thiersii Skay4041 TaxID=703135 RepID=A0A2A9NJD6_9AGAR|nr:hypothetical protein AMATHDRAFT_151285 [Amanita thiersii Skay4041]